MLSLAHLLRLCELGNTTPQVKFGKVPCISKLVEKIIDVRNGIPIFNDDLVKCPVFDV